MNSRRRRKKPAEWPVFLFILPARTRFTLRFMQPCAWCGPAATAKSSHRAGYTPLLLKKIQMRAEAWRQREKRELEFPVIRRRYETNRFARFCHGFVVLLFWHA
jgi:hypothetical protein